MIIAFCGEYASGKDFLCEHLVQSCKANRLSFSDEVRRLAVKIFPWLPLHFDPAIKDLPFVHPQNPHGLTPRDIWLLVGKVREVTPKYFVEAFGENNFNELDQCYAEDKLYIITDFRTPDEWDFIQSLNIPVIKIELESRGDRPPSAFEEFVRRFKEYDALFINKMDGTDRFDEFFKGFLNDQK